MKVLRIKVAKSLLLFCSGIADAMRFHHLNIHRTGVEDKRKKKITHHIRTLDCSLEKFYYKTDDS